MAPRIVPKLVFGATFVAVVPACALVACGGSVTGDDGGPDIIYPPAVAYCCFDPMGVADVAFKAKDANEGGS